MIQIAILGFGVVGGGTADLIEKNKDMIAARIGKPVAVKYILDIRDFPDSPYADRVVHDIGIIAADPEVSICAEVIGGVRAAYEFTKILLTAGKHVVSSNKELVATHGIELKRLAAENGVSYRFEASVGGGIPILRPLCTDLAANDIGEISGILNGTTNYILTQMFNCGADFSEALAGAQRLGYAEANPAADVEGIDACRKIAILTALATGKLMSPDSIHTEGITAIRSEDVSAAAMADYGIKLLGRMIFRGESLYVMVAPFLIHHTHSLSHVSDVFNAIVVTGNCVGEVMFYGRGAGALPTASAVVSDILNLAAGEGALSEGKPWEASSPADFSAFECRSYIAVSGVAASAVTAVFGQVHFIPTDNREVAFITETLSEASVEDKLEALRGAGATVLSRIRVF